MFCVRNNRPRGASKDRRRRAFTLLEVMLGVMVLGLIAVAIFRFVTTSLQAIKVSTADAAEKREIGALVSVLEQQFTNLPPAQPGALLGEAHQFSGKAADEIQWISAAGNGLFTENAEGLWKVTLLLKPDDIGNGYTLGLLRQVPDNSNKEIHWLPLLRDVDAIQVRYYDQRVNSWVEKWTDTQTRPSLVRIRIWKINQSVPYESVIELPPTKLPS